MFIIKDWMGNILFGGKEFKSFEDGWGYIYENVADEDNAYDDYFVEPHEDWGLCDSCEGLYELASRLNRCGDCGDCGKCCKHDKGEEE